MSMNPFMMRPRTMTGRDIALRGLAFVLLLVVSGLFLAVNLWLGLGFFFVALLLFIILGFEVYQGRNVLLLLYAILLGTALVSALIYPYLINNPGVRSYAQTDPIGNAFLGSFEMTAVTSILIGFVVSFLVVMFAYLIVCLATAVILHKWYESEDSSFLEVFTYVALSLLGIGLFFLIVDDKELQGHESGKRRLEVFGGPGWLIVHPGHVVVFHRHGTMTRGVGLGPVMLKRQEKIRRILPLDPQGGPQEIENVLTRDRIPLKLTLLHACMVESDKDTKARLEEELEKAEAHVAELEATQDNLPDEINAAETQLQEAKRKLYLQRTESPSETRDRLERAFNAAMSEVQGSPTQEAEQRLKEAERELDYLNTETTPERQARLQDNVDRAEAHLNSLNETQKKLTEDLKTAQEDVESAQQELDALEDDEVIGDGYFSTYESTAKLAARRVPDVWGSVKFFAVNNVKDVFMTINSEELFTIEDKSGDLEARIDTRKIKEIEGYVFDNTKGRGIGKGIKLLMVDVNEVSFPAKVKEKIEEEIKTQIEERIQITNARIEESKAKAKIIEARATSQAKILEGQGEGEARAAVFREILRELKREDLLTQDEISSAVLRLISTTVSVKELEHFFKATTVLRQQQRNMLNSPEETNGAGEE